MGSRHRRNTRKWGSISFGQKEGINPFRCTGTRLWTWRSCIPWGPYNRVVSILRISGVPTKRVSLRIRLMAEVFYVIEIIRILRLLNCLGKKRVIPNFGRITLGSKWRRLWVDMRQSQNETRQSLMWDKVYNFQVCVLRSTGVLNLHYKASTAQFR